MRGTPAETKVRALWECGWGSQGGGRGAGPECPPIPHRPAWTLLLALVLLAVVGVWPRTEGPHGGGLAGSAEAKVWRQGSGRALANRHPVLGGKRSQKDPQTPLMG